MGSLAERGLTPAGLVVGVETVSPERAGALIDAHDRRPGFQGVGARGGAARLGRGAGRSDGGLGGRESKRPWMRTMEMARLVRQARLRGRWPVRTRQRSSSTNSTADLGGAGVEDAREILDSYADEFHVRAPLLFDRPGNLSTARSNRAMSSLSSPPIFRPSLRFATVVTLSAMIRDGESSPFRSSGSTARRISGALVSSVVNEQMAIEQVASKSSSCRTIAGHAWPV